MRDRRDNRDIPPVDNTAPRDRTDLLGNSWDIYAIHAKGDPNDVWYVGQSKNLWQRMDAHEQNTRSQAHKPLYAHLSSHEWEYRVLEMVDTRDEARTAERRWIRHFIETGHDLFNIQDRPRVVSPRDEKLGALRKKAKLKGVTLLEGALLAMVGREVTAYVWNDETGEYEGIVSGVLDRPLAVE